MEMISTLLVLCVCGGGGSGGGGRGIQFSAVVYPHKVPKTQCFVVGLNKMLNKD